MRLIGRNGRELKVGSRVSLDGERCWIIGTDEDEHGVHVESSDGNSWLVEPESIGARWNEEDFVNRFFENRRLDNW